MDESARWQRLRTILEGALELEGAARERWIVESCAGDAELAREAAQLLAHDSTPGALEPLAQSEVLGALEDAQIGTRVGPYVLERQVGTGGMGVVYLARRSAAEFEQVVALKLIKRGMDSDDLLRRFRRERAVLAGLQHPGIARLFDGGATDDGRPWLAMEFVEGERIDDWCRQHTLSIRARVALLLEVCAAVQYAHERLVVHRDLKPSNILVTREGQPKLLDFGIAKVLAPGGGDPSDRTQTELRRLTPAYASPEQLAGLQVTTAGDVYSLGVILYELLTGRRPFEIDTAAARGLPPKPSTRAVHSAAPARGPETARLRRQLAGDLDTILLTALAPEPERRYRSVESLAADLRRHLDGLPIHARPATTLYVVSKFVRRHRLAVASGAAILVSLVAGLAVARAGYVEAVEQRGRAEDSAQIAGKESARAVAVLDLTRRMLGGASPHDVKDADYTLRRLLDDFDAELAETPVADASVEASVRQIMGRAYRELGLIERAEVHLARALELAPEPAGAYSSEDLELRIDLLNVLHDRGDFDQVERECDRLLARFDPGTTEGRLVNRLLRWRGDARFHLEKYAEAEADLGNVLDAFSVGAIDQYSFQDAKGTLAKVLARTGRLEEAERVFLELLAAYEAGGRGASNSASTAHHNLGFILMERGRLDDAQVHFERALEIERGLHGSDHPEVGVILNGLARIHTARGDFAVAEGLLREALAIDRKAYGDRHAQVATALSGLASALQGRGDLEAAEIALRECLEIRRGLFGERHTEVARAMNNLGLLLRRRGQLDESEALLRESLAIRTELYGALHISTAPILANLSSVQLARGDVDGALDSARQAVEIQRSVAEPAPSALAATLAILGAAHLDRKDFAEACEAYEEALGIQRELLGPAHPSLARTLQVLGDANSHLERFDTAEARYREALAIRRGPPMATAIELEESGRALAALLQSLGRDLEAADLLEELELPVAKAH